MDQRLLFLVDTNVWLDHYLGFRENHDTSSRFVIEAVRNEIPLTHAATTAKDVHYFISAFAKRQLRESGVEVTEDMARAICESAWAHLDNLNQISTLVGMDLSDFWLASKIRSLGNDIEDNLLMAAATRVHATHIITRDKGLLGKSIVAALAPEDALVLMEAMAG